MNKPNLRPVLPIYCGLMLVVGCFGDDLPPAVAGGGDFTTTGGSNPVTSTTPITATETAATSVGGQDSTVGVADSASSSSSGVSTSGAPGESESSGGTSSSGGLDSSSVGSESSGGLNDSSSTGGSDGSGGSGGGGVCPDVDLGSMVPDLYRGSTVGLMDSVVPSCTVGNSEDIGLQWTAPTSGDFIFNTTGSEINATLSVFAGCGGAELGCNDDLIGVQAQLQLSLNMGQTILIVVDGFNESGNFVLNIVENVTVPGGSGFGDCVNNDPAVACNLDEICIDDGVPTVGVCAESMCSDASDCPTPPMGGTAPVQCADVTFDGITECSLDCSAGQTCPMGMDCFNNLLCVYEVEGGGTTTGMPPQSDCCSDNGASGCEDELCEAIVCGIDPFCCTNAWDDICGQQAGMGCAGCMP